MIDIGGNLAFYYFQAQGFVVLIDTRSRGHV
jgi:hypothetical protein